MIAPCSRHPQPGQSESAEVSVLTKTDVLRRVATTTPSMAMSPVEDEWEYEYDQDATDVFLLDLDFTSLNGNLKSDIPGKRPLDRPDQASAGITGIRQHTPPIEDDLSATPDTFIDLEPPFAPALNSVQILDFASHNPIISYRNEVYSCTWSDMIGTNMFFSNAPGQLSEPDIPVELLGTSRIRLIGHRAKIAVKTAANAEPARRGRPEKGSDSRPALVTNNPAFKRQADFLEKLQEAKKAKGETDIVRTVGDGSGDLGTSRSRRPNTLVEGQ